jgi:putative flippase GtrA
VHQLKKWIAAPVESVLLQVPRALASSILAAFLNLGTVVLLVDELRLLDRYTAAALGYLAGGVLQYVLCLVWVFPASPGSRHATSFLQFMLLSLLGLPIAELVIVGATWLHLPTAFAVIASQGMTFSWNFCSRKLLLFRSPSAEIRERHPMSALSDL